MAKRYGMADPGEAEQITVQQPTTPVEEVKSEAKPDYESQFHGLKGNFEQLHAQFEQNKRELAQLKLQQQQWEQSKAEADADAAEERSLAEAKALLAQAPEDAVEVLRNNVLQKEQQLQEKRRLRAQEKEIIPKVQRETADNVHKFYLEGVREYAKAEGIPEADLKQALEESNGQYDKLLVSLGRKVAEREVKKKGTMDIDSLKASLKEDLLAELRGSKPTPDAGTGSSDGRTYDTFDEVEAGWLSGEVSDKDYYAKRKEHGLR